MTESSFATHGEMSEPTTQGLHERARSNFFAVGTGKIGTMSLYHYLKQHPGIFMIGVKEPGYFAAEVRAENLTPSARRHTIEKYVSDPLRSGPLETEGGRRDNVPDPV